MGRKEERRAWDPTEELGGVDALVATVEYARAGVRANRLCPGGTMTTMMAEIDRRRVGADHCLERHPIGRCVEPAGIAGVATFLVCDESSFVLGAARMVDGGYSTA